VNDDYTQKPQNPQGIRLLKREEEVEKGKKKKT